ncbi:hypothetical protein ACOCGL_003431 [Vibrio cholerae]
MESRIQINEGFEKPISLADFLTLCDLVSSENLNTAKVIKLEERRAVSRECFDCGLYSPQR